MGNLSKQKRLAAPSRARARVRARGLRSDRYREEVEVGKRWRLARDGGWHEVEVGKRWRLARGHGVYEFLRRFSRHERLSDNAPERKNIDYGYYKIIFSISAAKFYFPIL